MSTTVAEEPPPQQQSIDADLEPRGSRDDTLTGNIQSMLIVFILAFIFKGFIAEVYVIPTGSMAPTLLGAHLKARSDASGSSFPVSYGDITPTGAAVPIQGARDPISVDDPMLMNERYRHSRQGPAPIQFSDSRLRMGDRIFVLRVPYVFLDPKRYEIVVFKGPHGPHENLIKRVIGVPSESIWLADGDVFSSNESPSNLDSFQIRRKPEEAQRRLWRPVYHSDYIPFRPDAMTPSWTPPWTGDGWLVEDRRSYRLETASASTLRYRSELKPITDALPYNEPMIDRGMPANVFNVADVRLAAGVRPDEEGLRTVIHLEARGHEFEAALDGERAVLRMRPINSDAPAAWNELATAPAEFGAAGEVSNVEFWHVDQALWLWINDELAAYAAYDWSANERLEQSTGLSGAAALARFPNEQPYIDPDYMPGETRLSWSFEGSPVTLYRVELDRDIYYQPDVFREPRRSRSSAHEPARATHPASVITLSEDEMFVAGDNSAASNDSRLWDESVPWIELIDPKAGVVNQDLMLGRAFYVYYPSPEGLGGGGNDSMLRFVPGFGRMRFIR